MSKKKIMRSGVLPYYIEENTVKMLFMRPSDPKFGGDTFQIAKGKQEEGEDSQTAGLREGKEELGLFSGNIEEIHNLGKFLGRTDIFVVKITDPQLFGDPCFETAETRWMTLEEFQNEGRGLHIPIVKAAVRLIEKEKL